MISMMIISTIMITATIVILNLFKVLKGLRQACSRVGDAISYLDLPAQ